MKKTLMFLLIIWFNITLAQEPGQTFLVDFGTNDITNGNITISPDTNGNYWNNAINATTSAPTLSLVNQIGTSTSYSLNILSAMSTNGILNGGLLTPNTTLGDLAVATATQDYFFTANSGSFIISGLNPLYGYKFSMFGSRNSVQTRITEYIFNGANTISGTLQTSGNNIGGNGYNGNNSNVYLSDYVFPNSSGQIEVIVLKNSGAFGYLNNMQISEYPDADFCSSVDDLKISIMGSSVARGVGANNLEGYASLYGNLLQDRYTNGNGENWNTVNISIGGNDTLDVLARWESDLIPECGKYVVYGLSLGNEGIKTGGQPIFEQFRDNMLLLIQQAEDEGMVPIVMNNYSRGDFNDTDYGFIKDINLLIHQWDVPSVNLLGAIDNGSGNWVDGYWADIFHPNTAGHTEFYYAIVPSLFDALNDNKPLPQLISNTYLEIGGNSEYSELLFIPENIVHSFTTSFDIKTTENGIVLSLKNETQEGSIAIDETTNSILYTSPENTIITGTDIVNDNLWHKITLTHFFARGETILYIDNIEQGTINENLSIDEFYLNAVDNNDTIHYRDWFFYRSGMNQDEINALNNGQMLKSSLELYAPLDGQAVLSSDPLVNLAQSTNTISESPASLSIEDYNDSNTNINLFPNPFSNELNLNFFNKTPGIVDISIYNISGKKLLTLGQSYLEIGWYNKTFGETMLILESGLYLCIIKSPNNTSVQKIIKL